MARVNPVYKDSPQYQKRYTVFNSKGKGATIKTCGGFLHAYREVTMKPGFDYTQIAPNKWIVDGLEVWDVT